MIEISHHQVYIFGEIDSFGLMYIKTVVIVLESLFMNKLAFIIFQCFHIKGIFSIFCKTLTSNLYKHEWKLFFKLPHF